MQLSDNDEESQSSEENSSSESAEEEEGSDTSGSDAGTDTPANQDTEDLSNVLQRARDSDRAKGKAVSKQMASSFMVF